MIHDSDDPHPVRGILISLSILLLYIYYPATMWPDMTHLPVYSLPHPWHVSSKRVRNCIYSIPIYLVPRTVSGTLLGFNKSLWNKLGDEWMISPTNQLYHFLDKVKLQGPSTKSPWKILCPEKDRLDIVSSSKGLQVNWFFWLSVGFNHLSESAVIYSLNYSNNKRQESWNHELNT